MRQKLAIGVGLTSLLLGCEVQRTLGDASEPDQDLSTPRCLDCAVDPQLVELSALASVPPAEPWDIQDSDMVDREAGQKIEKISAFARIDDGSLLAVGELDPFTGDAPGFVATVDLETSSLADVRPLPLLATDTTTGPSGELIVVGHDGQYGRVAQLTSMDGALKTTTIDRWLTSRLDAVDVGADGQVYVAGWLDAYSAVSNRDLLALRLTSPDDNLVDNWFHSELDGTSDAFRTVAPVPEGTVFLGGRERRSVGDGASLVSGVSYYAEPASTGATSLSSLTPDARADTTIEDLIALDGQASVQVGTTRDADGDRAFVYFIGFGNYPDEANEMGITSPGTSGCCVVQHHDAGFVAVVNDGPRLRVLEYEVDYVPTLDPDWDGGRVWLTSSVTLDTPGVTAEAVIELDADRVLVGGWQNAGATIEPWLAIVDLDAAVPR